MTRCGVCPRACDIVPGGSGFCGARGAVLHPCTGEETVVSLNYGKLTSIALDPVEKKPLNRFYPGKKILSVGSFGCNLVCPWCQNHTIARAVASDVGTQNLMPEGLADLAEEYLPAGNIGVAFTYNEPLISYEFVRDTSRILKQRGLVSVLVTNGYAEPSVFESLLPLTDAMNIDLKSIKDDFYRRIGGGLETVMQNIRAAARSCHVELTCLLIEGENDAEEEMEEMSEFIVSVSTEIPLHITRCFPAYRMKTTKPTPIESMEKFRDIAKSRLKYVYLGNV